MSINRRKDAYSVRVSAAETARERTHPKHLSNGDEQKYSGANYAMSFTKGLAHCEETGLVKNGEHFQAFRTAINNGEIDAFNERVPVPLFTDSDGKLTRRQWEAPTAGVVYDLEGPDAQAVTMAPAPALGSDELAFEMAEVYELALLRDEPFHAFDANGGSAKLTQARDRLRGYAYAKTDFPNRPRKTTNGKLDRETLFRGSSPGVEHGPYISQFLLIGNDIKGIAKIDDGQIMYGAQRIDQRVPVAKDGDDYMIKWSEWKDVQDGKDVRGKGDPGQKFETGKLRFIQTPRDLATYVHFDALYQAYLNACLILLGMGTPTDPGFSHLAGKRARYPNSVDNASIPLNVGGFALYGGPHILTLVTEVATRALKAARFQKFNNHLRLRPEALAARLSVGHSPDLQYPQLNGAFAKMRSSIQQTVDAINANNNAMTGKKDKDALLPMAFAEGSPMHPTYAAGHASVAGACVTILKAYFDTGTVFVDGAGGKTFRHVKKGEKPPAHEAYEAYDNGKSLRLVGVDAPLTLEGELNKLAANISIGRNMAGVHYFSDYYDSLRMGEEIAIGMLEEQALCYPTDPFVMSLRTFDGETIRIGAL